MTGEGIWIWDVVLLLLAASFVLAFVRLALGRSVADRVVALEVMATLGVATTATLAVEFAQPVFLDVAVVLALISFVGTVAMGVYLERRSGS
jgi:multicomponent Na+:H+ antiporter subunit F